jgi:hypothetical protein
LFFSFSPVYADNRIYGSSSTQEKDAPKEKEQTLSILPMLMVLWEKERKEDE